MKLGKKQEKFSRMRVYLYTFILSQGYEIRAKHLLRCPDCKVGHARSLHKVGLAEDLVLTKDGVLLTKTKDYEFAGVYWESIGGSWGGRFQDGGHFSLKHGGMR